MTERRLRVAMLLDRFPVVSETFILNQITSLIDLGHEVDVYARWRPDSGTPVHPDVAAYGLLERTTYVDEQLPPESGYWELSAFPPEGQTWVPGSPEPIENRDRWRAVEPLIARLRQTAPEALDEVLDVDRYGYQAASLSALHRLAVLAGTNRAYDVVHAHFGPAANTFRFARLLWRAPLVVTFHGYDLGSFPREQGSRVYSALFASADAVTVNSRHNRCRLIRLGCAEGLIEVLPVGVDLTAAAVASATVRLSPRPLRVLAIARLVPVKGLRYLIEAVPEIARTGPVIVDLVGEGPLRDDLAALARKVGAAGSIRFHGALPAPAVHLLLGECDVFVLPSIEWEGNAEGQGLVLQEAQAAGIPVVATSTGGIPEGMVDGVTGLLVPPADPAALATVINRLSDNPDQRQAMGRAGRQFVAEHFDQQRLTERVEQLYRSVIRPHGRGWLSA